MIIKGFIYYYDDNNGFYLGKVKDEIIMEKHKVKNQLLIF